MKELIINVCMLIKTIIKARLRRFIIVFLHGVLIRRYCYMEHIMKCLNKYLDALYANPLFIPGVKKISYEH